MKKLELIRLRKQRGYTQTELARKLDISRSRYNNYENGYNKIPLDIAIKLQEILKYKKLDIF